MSNETKGPQPPAEAQAQGVGGASVLRTAAEYHYAQAACQRVQSGNTSSHRNPRLEAWHRQVADAIASVTAPPAEAQERPAKPAECADGCPDQQVCDHCQWPPGPDAEAQPDARGVVDEGSRAAQQQGGGDLDEVVCLACGDHIMPMGQVCHACSHPVSEPPSAPVGVEVWLRPVVTQGEYVAKWGFCNPDEPGATPFYSNALAQQPTAVCHCYTTDPTNCIGTDDLAGLDCPCKCHAQQPAAHPDDAAVDSFAAAMKQKLADARAKGRGGWDGDEPGMQQRLSDMLRAHVEKGDPRDVANFAMFLHQRGEAILPGQQPAAGVGEEIMVNAAHDVYTLPLQPSGLSSGPRFVVHVPGPEQPAAVEESKCMAEILRKQKGRSGYSPTVDEAMVERALRAFHAEGPSAKGTEFERDSMREALTAAFSMPPPVECPHRTRCDCLAACKYGMAGDGALTTQQGGRADG